MPQPPRYIVMWNTSVFCKTAEPWNLRTSIINVLEWLLNTGAKCVMCICEWDSAFASRGKSMSRGADNYRESVDLDTWGPAIYCLKCFIWCSFWTLVWYRIIPLKERTATLRSSRIALITKFKKKENVLRKLCFITLYTMHWPAISI